MKMELARGWELNVARGPDWLFIRLMPPQRDLYDGHDDLAQRLWDLLEQSFCHRVVIELDEVPILASQLIGQLLRLQRRVCGAGGIMRICGLSPECEAVLRINRLQDRLVPYRDRNEAVMGGRRTKPR